MWRPALQRIAHQGTKAIQTRIVKPRFSSGRAGPAYGEEQPGAVKVATDTYDLIDQLLKLLGHADSSEPGFVFFDLDETIVTRETSLIHGLNNTKALLSRLEAFLGRSSKAFRFIQQEMERDYYEASPRLVDPLLLRVIRDLKIQGHSVFGLTSNTLDHPHTRKILQTLAKYKIRFSAPVIRGELPRCGSLVMDHSVSRGMLFVNNQQTTDHDKGEVIVEFVNLLLQSGSDAGAPSRPWTRNGSAEEPEPFMPLPTINMSADKFGAMNSGSLGRKRKCVLVDNTSSKIEKAVHSFARVGISKPLEFHGVLFTEADNLIDPPDAVFQLRQIVRRLKAQGILNDDLAAGIMAQAQVD